MPTGDQGSVKHLTLCGVPVDVLSKLLSFFNDVKELKCASIRTPQEVQCVHMCSVAWDALVFCTNHCLIAFDHNIITLIYCNLSRNDCSVVLYWGMCKVTSHLGGGGSSVADVYRYVAA